MSGWVRMGVGICLTITLAGCQHGDLRRADTADCAEIEQGMNLSRRIATLNTLADAFSRNCYGTVIAYGAQAQSEFRHKTFSTVKETFSVFLPDGTLTDYVVESYERGFLNVLIAASYLHQGDGEAVQVELRRLDHELFAPLYNFGEDPVNILLSAVLWEQLGEMAEARVDWLRLWDLPALLKGQDETIRSFAGGRVTRIDEGHGRENGWHVYGIGTFPGVEWDLQFLGSTSGYFLVRPKQAFLPACVSDTGVRISTGSWFDKIAMRHTHTYHPLLNVQSWIRLPIGITYSLVPLTAGAGIAVGGCAVDVAGGGKGGLCYVSLVGGIALMKKAPVVLKGTLEPDLRHWEQIPAAFIATRTPELSQEPCTQGMNLGRTLVLF